MNCNAFSACSVQVLGPSDLEDVALRLRDKKLGVRKETATQLMSLFRQANLLPSNHAVDFNWDCVIVCNKRA